MPKAMKAAVRPTGMVSRSASPPKPLTRLAFVFDIAIEKVMQRARLTGYSALLREAEHDQRHAKYMAK